MDYEINFKVSQKSVHKAVGIFGSINGCLLSI